MRSLRFLAALTLLVVSGCASAVHGTQVNMMIGFPSPEHPKADVTYTCGLADPTHFECVSAREAWERALTRNGAPRSTNAER